jgi:hypothetical protein
MDARDFMELFFAFFSFVDLFLRVMIDSPNRKYHINKTFAKVIV